MFSEASFIGIEWFGIPSTGYNSPSVAILFSFVPWSHTYLCLGRRHFDRERGRSVYWLIFPVLLDPSNKKFFHLKRSHGGLSFTITLVGTFPWPNIALFTPQNVIPLTSQCLLCCDSFYPWRKASSSMGCQNFEKIDEFIDYFWRIHLSHNLPKCT